METPKLGNKLELMVLKSVLKLGNDAYGLSVRQDINTEYGFDYSIGAVYTTLNRLETKGFTTSKMAKPLPVRGGRARKQFKITALGKKLLAESESLALKLWNHSIGVTV